MPVWHLGDTPHLTPVFLIASSEMVSVANPHGRLILVVDDEPTVLRAVTATLAMAGFRVMVAENGAAGLDAFLRASR